MCAFVLFVRSFVVYEQLYVMWTFVWNVGLCMLLGVLCGMCLVVCYVGGCMVG